ncbi:50S ribosomal protein L11 methyltransferase [Aurantibacter crassamenti]|uniref:50S ribosomal protein L11 methyltransferase n=1 Tax=Aurantibacter crassamenti TaxID=1837375 RepID=UPI001939F039|nr:50S ribosomal protein L11 methyltransferase [Aurantibacter crassamenti]MBM1106285.1 50S ribosomal protein L11 methyltransferase [Aurantibacter crassamenti]
MSNLNYIEYTFAIHPVQPGAEILIAELGERNFESFVEQENGLLAYIKKADWSDDILEEITILENSEFQISFEFKEIEQENWNVTWETNFQPIQVENRCRVRAPFHEKLDFEYDIVIEPKMSFGTGHHETTQMMLRYVLENDFSEKSVLDMGSGTGVLAILAEMRGATKIDAIDIDNWCYLNALENVDRNDCKNITVLEGDARLLKTANTYDIILANINRNILLQDIPTYANAIKSGGFLFLSGFYADDIPMITDTCSKSGFTFQNNLQNGDWVAATFLKN